MKNAPGMHAIVRPERGADLAGFCFGLINSAKKLNEIVVGEFTFAISHEGIEDFRIEVSHNTTMRDVQTALGHYLNRVKHPDSEIISMKFVAKAADLDPSFRGPDIDQLTKQYRSLIDDLVPRKPSLIRRLWSRLHGNKTIE